MAVIQFKLNKNCSIESLECRRCLAVQTSNCCPHLNLAVHRGGWKCGTPLYIKCLKSLACHSDRWPFVWKSILGRDFLQAGCFHDNGMVIPGFVSLLKVNSHIPCRAHAVLRPCRSERDFSRPWHSTAGGTAWYVWINLARLETACGRPYQLRLLSAATWTFTKGVNQNAAAFWDVLNCSDNNEDSRLYEIWADRTVKSILYSVYLLRPHCLFFCLGKALRFRWSRGSVLAFGNQVCGFKPDRSRWIFQGEKNSSARLPSEDK